MNMTETYPQPKNGWTCFHCGETFYKPGCAQEHFGAIPERKAVCEIREDPGLLAAFRRLETEYSELLIKFQESDETVGHAMSSIASSLSITREFLDNHTKHLKSIKVDPLKPFRDLLT